MTLTLVLKIGFYPKEYIWELWKLYHLPFKSYGQCESFLQTKKHTNGQTDRSKIVCTRSIACGGGGITMLKFRFFFFFNKDDLENWPRPWRMTLNLIPTERSCHNEFTCLIWRPYHSKIMSNVKVLHFAWVWPWKLTLTLTDDLELGTIRRYCHKEYSCEIWRP